MALDPDIAAQVAHLFDATWAQVLSGEVAGAPVAGPMRRHDVDRHDAEVPGPAGPIRVRWYRSVALDEDELAPALVWVHGGGWQYGDLDMPEADSVAQVVAGDLPGVVVSVDYRLAPAHRHPAALRDVVAVHEWAVREGAGHGVDPGRVALGGGSAGGHLACLAALALAAAGRAPAALLLAYPVTDPVGGPYDERHPDCPPPLWLGRDGTAGLFAAYLGHDPADAADDVIPARADLASLPPTLVTTAECDSLRAQAVRFVELARSTGADVDHDDVPAVLHGYLNTVGDSPPADEALARHVDWLRQRLVG
ncbi:MAG: alpha/beta hydrolase [Acidimicrobiia bacterium]